MKWMLLAFGWWASLAGAVPPVSGEWIVTLDPDQVTTLSSEAQVLRRIASGVYLVSRPTVPHSPVGVWQPNYRYELLSGDPDLAKCWGLKNDGQGVDTLPPGTPGVDVGAVPAWSIAPHASSSVVAILDSGADLNHEDLKGAFWKNPGEIPGNGRDDDGNGKVDDVHGWNFGDSNSDLTDPNGHGTFCAGIVAAGANNGVGLRGVASGSRLMVLKFLDSTGMGSTASAVAAIDYAIENGAHVINASWGGTNYDPALYQAVKRAGEAGILFVAAAGNNGKDNDTDPKPIYPASFLLPQLVSVVALDNRDRFATFSNFGKTTTHIGAPGVRIYSTQPGGYDYGDGTSFAAPFVSGAAALVRSFFSGMDVSSLKDRLLSTSEVIDYYAKEKMQSAGRLHLYNALRDIRPPRPKAPDQWIRRPLNKQTPHPYENEQVYRYVIDHPQATHVRVRFTNFKTERCCDVVKVFDGEGRNVASYAGDLGDFWSADVLGDRLVVEFRPDFSMTDFGFDLQASQFSVETTLWSLLDHFGRGGPVEAPLSRWSGLAPLLPRPPLQSRF